MATVNVVDQVLFPGAHCLPVQLEGRLRMHKQIFCNLSRADDVALEQWEQSESTRPVKLCIPPLNGSTTLPTRPMLTFGKGAVDSEAIVSAEVAVIFFRRGQPKTEAEMDQVLDAHARLDLVPLVITLHSLAVDTTMLDPFVRAITMSLIAFYIHADPDKMVPVLKQKLFSVDTDAYIGRICARCGVVGAMSQCPCRTGVYYCGRECQRTDWRVHRKVCKRV